MRFKNFPARGADPDRIRKSDLLNLFGGHVWANLAQELVWASLADFFSRAARSPVEYEKVTCSICPEATLGLIWLSGLLRPPA